MVVVVVVLITESFLLLQGSLEVSRSTDAAQLDLAAERIERE